MNRINCAKATAAIEALEDLATSTCLPLFFRAEVSHALERGAAGPLWRNNKTDRPTDSQTDRSAAWIELNTMRGAILFLSFLLLPLTPSIIDDNLSSWPPFEETFLLLLLLLGRLFI